MELRFMSQIVLKVIRDSLNKGFRVVCTGHWQNILRERESV